VLATTCSSDLTSLCTTAGQQLSDQLRCMSVHAGDLSILCKAALMAAVQALSQHTVAPTPTPSTPGVPGPAQVTKEQLKACMPGIIKTCQPQLVEMMINPLYADGAPLVACAKAHSSTIGGACERVVESLTKDGFATDLIICGQSFMRLCPRESLQLMGSEATNKVNWKAVVALMKCLHPKRSQMTETCDLIEDAFESDEDTDWAKKQEQAGGGYGYGYGDKRDHQHSHDGDGGGGLIVLLMFCMCCCMGGGAGGYYYAKQQGVAELGWSSQRMDAMRAGQEFHQLQDQGGIAQSHPGVPEWAGPQPPHYAMVQEYDGPEVKGPIVTAHPVN